MTVQDIRVHSKRPGCERVVKLDTGQLDSAFGR